MSEPISKFPDPEWKYVLYTDASKYGWSNCLTQPYWSNEGEDKPDEISDNDKEPVEVLHPITYNSGLLKGSQINWAAFMKEAYAIFMSVRKLAYYITDTDVTLTSDHKPLKKFLEKDTLNKTVNNWAIEISSFRIKFEFISGIKNRSEERRVGKECCW